MQHHGVLQAIIACGGVDGLADRLKMTPGAIRFWRRRGIPLGRVLEVEKASGVPREVLRPDAYPRYSWRSASARR